MKFRIVLSMVIVMLVSTVFADGHGKKQKAVLVTGASSGIGLNITNHLVKAGYYVYAGARKEADIKRLDAMEHVSAVKLDVTVQEQIDAAAKFVTSAGRGLYGIVNNAGVGTFENISKAPLDDMIWIHDVNVFGPHRVNVAFLPLLTESKGRTTIIGSISGYLTPPISGAYSMSKMAAEVYSESMDVDLEQQGMHASLIAPGAYKSKIREKVAMHTITGNYKMGDDESKLSDEQKKQLEQWRANNAALKEPDEVSEAVLSFLADETPKTRYMVTPNKEQAVMTVTAAMKRMLEHNADQPYALSRDELIKLMDELNN